MMSVIGEAHPAVLATGHRWAPEHPFQGGALGTVAFRAAATRTAAQITARVTGGSYLFGVFRSSILFGHFWSLFLLRRAGSRCGHAHHFEGFNVFLMPPRVGEAHPAAPATGHRRVPHHPFLGGALGTVVIRAIASWTAAQITLRGMGGGHLISFRPGAGFDCSSCLSFLRKPACAIRLLPQL